MRLRPHTWAAVRKVAAIHQSVLFGRNQAWRVFVRFPELLTYFLGETLVRRFSTACLDALLRRFAGVVEPYVPRKRW